MRFLTLLLLSVSLNIYAQTIVLDAVKPQKVNISKSGKAINGMAFDFSPFIIENCMYNDSTHLLSLSINETEYRRGPDVKGNSVYCIDLNTMQVKYDYFYKGSSNFIFVDKNYIIRDEARGILVKDLATNKELSFNKKPMGYFSTKYHTLINTAGVAFDVNTGKKLWDGELQKSIAWHEIKEVGDDNIAISMEGLCYLNVTTGGGWYHKIKTTREDYTDAAVASMVGTAIGMTSMLLGGPGFIMVGSAPKVTHGMCSNILYADNRFYYAGCEKIMAVSKEGDILWRKKLVVDNSGKSKLWISGDTIFMLSLGYAYMEMRAVNQSYPFMTAYNKNTGEMLYYKEFDTKGYITDYTVRGNDLFVRCTDAICHFSLTKGERVMFKQLKANETLNRFRAIPNSSTYVFAGGKYQPIPAELSTKMLLRSGNDVAVIDDNGAVKIIDASNWASKISLDKEYSAYIKKDAVELYKGDTKLADLNEVPVNIYNNKLILRKGNSITIADLSGL